MKINNLLLSTLVLSCSIAQGAEKTPLADPAPTPTKVEAEKSIADTKTAIQENTDKITENTSTLRSLWKWTVDSSTKKAELTVTRTDDNKTSPFVIRGMCYSPAPMNASNKFGPALGDWYWDSLVNPDNPNDVWAYAWESAWARDLDHLRALGINCIRVYSMLYKQIGINGEVPTAATYPTLPTFLHRRFLDLCWNNGKNPIYVLVGIPMPFEMYKLNYPNRSKIQYYWEHVLEDTAKDLEKHPAVLGFTVGNEIDLADYVADPVNPHSPQVQYWWEQLRKFSQKVKTVAPNKLVGIGFFDNPNIVKFSESYMNQCTSIDFWGVNTYQTTNFNPVFGNNVNRGYNHLTGVALKPVILTEWGIPATGHHDPNDPSSIYSDTATQTETARVIKAVLPKAYVEPLCLGVTYFEFCDEWWKQPGTPIYEWNGGDPNPGFPNGYTDEEGFGVYSIERAGYNGNNPRVRQLPPYFQWPTPPKNPSYNGPYQPDVLTERTPVFNAVKKVFSDVK
jgi:hypothetical protein